jgi:hypothetical protein
MRARLAETALGAMVVAVIIGCPHDVTTSAATVNLWSDKALEKCVDLTPGQTLVYRFSADHPVLFNVHHHRGEELVEAVPEQLATRRSGTLEPRVSAQYCLMWTNPSAGTVKIDYDYNVR